MCNIRRFLIKQNVWKVLTKHTFIDIIYFTNRVKVVKRVKVNRQAIECVENKFLKLPNVQKYEITKKTENGFIATVEMEDGYEFRINAVVISQVFPSTVMQLIERQKSEKRISVLISPYISERTAQICEEHRMGYFDYAGNCWFVGHSIYLSEKGNKNIQPKEQKAISIFEKSSVVSSLILRELFADITKVWKLKHLSEKVNCSIGQVSKVMNYLVQNVWAEKTKEGYLLKNHEALLREWGKIYGNKELTAYNCYTLDNISSFEKKLQLLKEDTGIETYLTGFAGGVRYAPVVRYNKVHVFISPEDIPEAIRYLDVKEVNSGANVVIIAIDNDSYIKDSREINKELIVSPVQIYLDSMQLKGRGEELAEAVLRKEILK